MNDLLLLDELTLAENLRADTILADLSNPLLDQETFEAESQWKAAESQLERFKVQVESGRLTRECGQNEARSRLRYFQAERTSSGNGNVNDVHSVRRKLMNQGVTAQQAHDQAWEMVRKKFIFLLPENGEQVEAARNQATTGLLIKTGLARAPSNRSVGTTSKPSGFSVCSKRRPRRPT